MPQVGHDRPSPVAVNAAQACVVVPVYRDRPEPTEILSLTQLAARLGGHQVALVAPAGLDVSAYRAILGDPVCHYFDASFFRSREHYNALMLSEPLYARFAGWEYVLIHQTDAFVFEDHLAEWCGRGLDYVAPPFWAQSGRRKDLGMVGVGNGGFSLRRVEACQQVLSRARRFPRRLRLLAPRSDARTLRRARRTGAPEDEWWGHHPRLAVATVDEALRFGFDTGLENLLDVYREVVPFGCHAVWNLLYIEGLRQGIWADRELRYQEVLHGILERSGNLG
jgi:hypothetical protein